MKLTGQNSRTTWAVIGVAILAVIALALSAMALLNTRGSSESHVDYTFTPETETEPDTDASAEEEGGTGEENEPEAPEPAPEISIDPHTRFISLGSQGQLIRGEFGSCEGAAGWAEVSQDGGNFWELSNTEVQEAMQLMGVDIGLDGYVELSALDGLCDPFLLRSYIGGYSWQYAPGEIDARWFSNPREPGVVNTPFGAVEAPCEVIQLSVSESATRAGVLCEDSTVMMSEDDGATWSAVAESTGAVAIAMQDDRVLAFKGASDTCAGIQLQTLSAGSATDLGPCLDLPSASGEVAVDAYGTDVVIWAADTLLWSIDGGSAWL